MEKFNSFILKVCMWVMGLMTVFVIVSVFLRYVFGISYAWASELINFMFIFTTFFGAVVAERYDEHISIDYFYKKMPPTVQKWIKIVFKIIIIIVQIQIIRVSFVWIEKTGNVLSAGLRIPFSYIYGLLPLSAFLLIVFALGNIVDLIFLKNEKN